ncbi:MAG TPA: 16S rRNA (guanine(527)-N(7))-methyltransferase RsmG [Flexivirga sp.]|uniref:16S rRNA (guanine(527)-N(7))-methyltransferase RsmG n=1 Tax=Flexivirga sp. TaxID=1962927 RepID=UPI002B62972D|nr:16S rRNA (guanine(527)-N(7))-methyltransferase RsmG [Flexivirga sp.]HWC22684.1 16S rRNA (guanine(527)-N(7))-methyltransferase RsmG [Flexivirga sp.]
MKHDPPQHGTGGLETADVPAAPAQAAAIFGDRFPLAQQYAELLAGSGVVRGLIGPREAPRLWERHILNCAVITELIDPDSTVADVGSGAGLPGLVIAVRRPDVSVTLIEPLLRRVRWLDEVVQELGLTNVTVARGRAESLWDEVAPADVVTSRAVSALENLAVWSVPLVRPGGWWLPMKGSSVADEIEQSRDLLSSVGVTEIEVVECGVGVLDEPTIVARLAIGTPRRLGKNAAGKGTKKPGRRQSADRRPQDRRRQ